MVTFHAGRGRFLTGLLLALLYGLAMAEEAVPVIPQVLTPARLAQAIGDVPASVTVIDRELIEASGAREIFQLFLLVPGMSAINVDTNIPTVSYHGTLARDTRRMLVLIDGRAMYQPGLARVLWNDFPLEIEDIERIEVTRGPASAAYGANAFQGVINIISRHPADVHRNAVVVRHGENGVADWRTSWVMHGAEQHLRVTLAERNEDGFDKPLANDVLPQFVGRDPRADKRIQTLNLRYQHELDAGEWELLAGGSRSFLDRPEQENLFLSLDILEPTDLPVLESERWFAQGRLQMALNDDHFLRVDAYAQQQTADELFAGCVKLPGQAPDEFAALLFSRELHEEDIAAGGLTDADVLGLYLDPTTAITAPAIENRLTALALSGAGPLCGNFENDVEEHTTALSIEDVWTVNERLRMVLGASIYEHYGYSETYLGSGSNTSTGAFTNIEIRLPAHLLVNLGAYWEKDDLNGEYVNPRAALNWRPWPQHSWRAVYAESVRTPDLYEQDGGIRFLLRDPQGPYALDPVGLLGWAQPTFFQVQTASIDYDAEKIVSRELGYFGAWRSLEWDIRVFDEALKDLISDDFQPYQGNTVYLDGNEIQVTWRPHPAHLLRATAAHIHTRSIDGETGYQERREMRLAARDMGSFLWRFDVTPRWMFSTAWYLASNYNVDRYRYERLDMQLKNRVRVGKSELEWGVLFQRDMTADPAVFEENRYEENKRGWLTLGARF